MSFHFSIEEILCAAREAGASDVHLAAGLPPRMRVNGKLVTMSYPGVRASDALDILVHVMSQAQRESFEEKGEYDFSFSVPGCGRCRANAYRQKGSVAFALHLVDTEVPSPEELGMPEAVTALHERESGLVLVTGPSGSGRSATLAALVNRINENRAALVITLEDPIEYVHQHKRAMVNQREIGQDSRSYAEALRAVLREDPDVVLVGELRDCESVSAAITAAETGHLVLAALHAGGAVNALELLVEMFPPHRQEGVRARLADVLEAVISQRLIPADKGRRAAAFEVLMASQTVRSHIRTDRILQLGDVLNAGAEEGMVSMDEALRRLYVQGRIDRNTAARYMRDAEGLDSGR